MVYNTWLRSGVQWKNPLTKFKTVNVFYQKKKFQLLYDIDNAEKIYFHLNIYRFK